MIILAIDPGVSSGWAYTRGKWGVQKFRKRDWQHPNSVYLDLRAWLLERIETLGVNAIATEGVISSSKFNNNGTRHEWKGVLSLVAAEADLPLAVVMPTSLKKYATGDGRAERPAMRAALRERFGIDLPEDQHDAIAAIWVLSWATREAQEGRLSHTWSGFPNGVQKSREVICNRCQLRFPGGLRCPRCGSVNTRLEA